MAVVRGSRLHASVAVFHELSPHAHLPKVPEDKAQWSRYSVGTHRCGDRFRLCAAASSLDRLLRNPEFGSLLCEQVGRIVGKVEAVLLWGLGGASAKPYLTNSPNAAWRMRALVAWSPLHACSMRPVCGE